MWTSARLSLPTPLESVGLPTNCTSLQKSCQLEAMKCALSTLAHMTRQAPDCTVLWILRTIRCVDQLNARLVVSCFDQTYIYSNFEPFDAHRMLPCFDQPDLKAQLALTVTAPKDWVVVGNAAVEACSEQGESKRWEFKLAPQLSTYLYAVIAGPYVSVTDEYNGMSMGIYARGSLQHLLEQQAPELFTLTKQGLAW